MPQIASAKKRVKVAARQTLKNNLHRTRARTAMKNIRSLAAAGKGAEASAAVPTAQRYLDKAAKVRALHPRTVARYKSRLVATVKSVKGAAVPAKTVKKAAASDKKTAPKTAKPSKPAASEKKTS